MSNVCERIYPSLRRVLRTQLSALEAERALACEVQDPRWRELFGTKRGTFEGTIGRGSFDIQRSAAYQNAVFPRIRGRINAGPVGASISIEMSLSPTFLFLIALLICSFALPLFAEASPLSVRLPSLFGLGLVWTMTVLAFRFEAARTERDLLHILGATVSEP